jgi:hypothetical protein
VNFGRAGKWAGGGGTLFGFNGVSLEEIKASSMNLVVCSNDFQKNDLFPVMFDKLEDEAEVIPGAARPRTGKFPF